ncbi:MAG TPA: hypothetical protein VMC84_06045 [Methanocella sp.]|uniref:hypothetical protein n=1 Tax=Methanocella sp. TaxID=2052833 RepID=UPI002C71D11F|nr:hypothetical protein [Methanocella sp.]HTY90723.1 hypothetical protein [Methanocella sp.]
MSVNVSSAAEAAEYAVKDLAAKLGIQPGNIIVAESREMTWPDASLGMPKPGMVYAQMLTEGYRVVLEAAGKRYEYHFGEGSVRKRSQ